MTFFAAGTLVLPRIVAIHGELGTRLLYAVASSALGGFLSVAIGVPHLTIEDYFWINFFYGGLRIIIALICGIAMTFLVRAGIALTFLKDPSATDGFIVAALLAGFSEKLVPNVLVGLDKKSKIKK
jgi:hypothetical protein